LSTQNPNDAELHRRAQDDRLGDDYKVEVGSVVKYYAGTHEADIKIAPARPLPTVDGEIAYEVPPVLPHVPVIAFGTDRSFFQTPLQPGDRVLLLFCGRSPTEFFAGANTTQPGDLARHGLSGGLAIPFVLPGHASGASRLALLSDLQAILTALATATAGGDPLVMTPPTLVGTVEVKAK
jgi:Phage protein Gp138 N-terminal domain